MKKYSLIAFFAVIALYALFQARFVILGPSLAIESPQDNALVDAGTVTVRGTARNISHLFLDDRQIYTDTAGHFEEKLIASPGLNIIRLEGKDRFGRQKEKTVRIVAR